MTYSSSPISPVVNSHGYCTLLSIVGENEAMGLTKREYFAAMAMQGILANSEFMKNHKDIDIHSLSVNNADDLIKELNK